MRTTQSIVLARSDTIAVNLSTASDFCSFAHAYAPAESVQLMRDSYSYLAKALDRGVSFPVRSYAFDYWAARAAEHINRVAAGAPFSSIEIERTIIDFTRFALAASVSSNDTVEFAIPLAVQTAAMNWLPAKTELLGSSFVLRTAAGRAYLNAVELSLGLSEAQIGPFVGVTERCQLDESGPLFEFDVDWETNRASYDDLLEGALNFCRRSDRAGGLIDHFIGNVVPIVNRDKGRHKSLSIDLCFGTIFASFDCSSETLAEALIHEADHQCLYQVCSRRPLLEESDLELGLRSPWRKDPRPPMGLLFGASAFSRVASCFVEVSGTRLTNDLGARCTLYTLQVLDALATIRDRCQLTQDGEKLIAILTDEIVDATNKLSLWRPFEQWRNAALSTIAGDKREWESENA